MQPPIQAVRCPVVSVSPTCSKRSLQHWWQAPHGPARPTIHLQRWLKTWANREWGRAILESALSLEIPLWAVQWWNRANRHFIYRHKNYFGFLFFQNKIDTVRAHNRVIIHTYKLCRGNWRCLLIRVCKRHMKESSFYECRFFFKWDDGMVWCHFGVFFSTVLFLPQDFAVWALCNDFTLLTLRTSYGHSKVGL